MYVAKLLDINLYNKFYIVCFVYCFIDSYVCNSQINRAFSDLLVCHADEFSNIAVKDTYLAANGSIDLMFDSDVVS